MSATPVLRYFPCRGRAQPIRDALLDAGVAFDDVVIPLEQWPHKRTDPSVAGPYRGLPTLTWDGVDVAETLPIAGFVARKLGQSPEPRLEAVTSVAYLDLIMRVGEIIWADMVYPGSASPTSLERVLPRLLAKLDRLEEVLGDERWFSRAETPHVADFFAFEGYDAVRYALGPGCAENLGARLPKLTAHRERVQARPALARAAADRPAHLTARPNEGDVVATLHDHGFSVSRSP